MLLPPQKQSIIRIREQFASGLSHKEEVAPLASAGLLRADLPACKPLGKIRTGQIFRKLFLDLVRQPYCGVDPCTAICADQCITQNIRHVNICDQPIAKLFKDVIRQLHIVIQIIPCYQMQLGTLRQNAAHSLNACLHQRRRIFLSLPPANPDWRFVQGYFLLMVRQVSSAVLFR